MIDILKKKLSVYIDNNPKKSDLVAFTISSKNYLHYSLTVRESFLKNNKNADFYIFVVDVLSDKKEMLQIDNLLEQGVKIVFLKEIINLINIPEYENMLFRYDILEVNTAFKPFILEYMLLKGFEKVVYFDPDCFIFHDISELENTLDNYNIVLTPHIFSPYQDDKLPKELNILHAGIYNLGFIGIKKSTTPFKFLKWWQNHLVDECYMQLDKGMHVDQKWIDFVPIFFDKVHILKNKGYNVAYWNLHERPLKKINNIYYADENKIVFFHFSGLQSDVSKLLSKHQDRYNINDNEIIAELVSIYTSKIKENGKNIFSSMKYYFNEIFYDKLPVTKEIRRRFFNELVSFIGNIYKPDYETYSKYFDFVYKDMFSDKSLNRYAFAFWEENQNLKLNFRNLHNITDRNNLTNTLKKHKPKEQYLYEFPPKKENLKINFGVNTVGYNAKSIGIAEVSRSFIKNLYSVGMPYSIINLESPIHSNISNEELSEFKKYETESPVFNTNILFCNADVINNVFNELPQLKKAKNNIGVFWWEFEDYFNFPNAFDNINEVLTFSSIVTKAVKKVAPRRVKVRQLIFPFINQWKISHTKEETRQSYNIAKEDFVFIFNFDFLSSIERKNPFGLLDAFSLAFENNTDVKLIIKSTNFEQKTEEFKLLSEKVKEKSLENKIVFINESLPKNLLMSIINSSDAYISMHRSEGFGIGMLEAMFLSKPVIATKYGGNTDFMDDNNSLLIDYKMTEVKNEFGPYKKGWLWAEPDIYQAAEYMKKLYFDRKYCSEIGRKAYHSVIEQYSMQNIQMSISKYLQSFC